jgi:3-oxoacyl-[acyl-carrier protein] reductase
MDLISTLRYAAAAAAAAEPTPKLHPDLVKAYSLSGRAAVVTGAGSGIGRQTAITFAQAGARVIIADVNSEGLDETAANLKAVDGDSEAVVTDVSSKSSVDALAERAMSWAGRIDVWANVAGIISETLIVDATEEMVARVVGVNQLGVYWGCAAAARAMIPTHRGSIINVASAGGELPAPTLSIYGMTKAAVISITRSLAAEVGQYGIRVNAVSPGFVETGMTRRNWDKNGQIDEAKRAEVLAARARVPLARIGTTEDIAQCLLFLAADASGFVTGQVVRPNGGVMMA